MTGPIDTASVEVVFDFSGAMGRLKSDIDAALRGVTQRVEAAFEQAERSASSATREMGQDFQRGGERAEMALREVATQAKVSMAEVGASTSAAGAGISAKLGGALATVKMGLLGIGVAAGAGLAAMTGFGLKSAASLEQVQIGMTALVGSAQVAQQFLSELQQFAANTPFEFAGVADASRRILAFGQAVGITREEVIPTLTVIGNLVSVLGGTQESIDSVVRAFGQMSSKGKISQEELLQLAEALPGFNANAAIAASLGLSVAETMEKITAGEVDATTGINALLAGMGAFPGAAGAMAQQAQSLTGVFSTFKDTVSIALTNAFQPVIPEIKSALAELTPILGSAIGELAPSLGGALSAILPILGKLIKAIVPILTPILDALGPALDALGPALQPLGEAIGQVMVALAPVLPVLAEFIGVLAQLAVPVLLLLAVVLKPLTPILEFMARAIGEVGRALAMIDWKLVGDAISNFAAAAWGKIKEFFEFIGKAFTEFPENFRIVFEYVRQIVVDKLTEIRDYFLALPGRLLDALGDLGALLIEQGKNLIRGLWNGISAMGGWLWSQVTGFVQDKIIGPMKNALKIGSPSRLMAEEIGEPIGAGIGIGVRDSLPDVAALIASLGAGPVSGSSVAGATGAAAVGNIIVNVMFSGAVPTTAEARATGQAAGEGVASALARRGIAVAAQRA
ncbi:MAG TPA: tape measure protein [Actinoplanes sp.]|nr:tape measure protein [Actinoplanes sp.]